MNEVNQWNEHTPWVEKESIIGAYNNKIPNSFMNKKFICFVSNLLETEKSWKEYFYKLIIAGHYMLLCFFLVISDLLFSLFFTN